MRAPRQVTMFACGDVMLGRGIDQVLRHSVPAWLHEDYVTSAEEYVTLAERANGPIPRRVAPSYPWGDALAVLEAERPDARLVNLETSVTTSEDIAPKQVTYRTHPANVVVLAVARIDCCTLANNHVGDWGEAGLLETVDTLRAAGLRPTGAGRTLAEAQAPAIVDLGAGARMLVFALGAPDCGIPTSWAAGEARPGVHLLPGLSDAVADRIAALVGAARREGDLVVASIHWGSNWGYEVPVAHRRFAHLLLDRAGVDMVHGHSSHHPRGIEIHRGRPILYGCGDFLNDYEGIRGHERYRGDLVLMYLPTFDMERRELVALRLVPMQVRRFQLKRPSAGDFAWLRQAMDDACRPLGCRVERHGEAFAIKVE